MQKSKFRILVEEEAQSFMYIDPGTHCAGVAVLQCKGRPGNVLDRKVLAYKKIMLDRKKPVWDRYLTVTATCLAVAEQWEPFSTYIEYPPDTIYYDRSKPATKFTIPNIVARAQSIFTLVHCCGDIMATFRESRKRIVPVYPRQWQPSPKARGGLGTKEWSLTMGTKILHDACDTPRQLTSKTDENVADAICFGWYHTQYCYMGRREMK